MVDKKDVKDKVDDIKSGASDKKDDVTDRLSEMKGDAMDKKEDIQEDVKDKMGDIKSGASDASDDIQEEAGKRKTQTDKLLKDIMNTIKVKQVEVGKTISGYTTPPKPSADIIETKDNIIIKIDLPGVTKEDIDIGIAGERIDILVKFQDEIEGEDINYIQKERSYGETKRTIKLPSEIKVKDASANFKESVLTIKLPKIEIPVHKININ